MPIKHPRCYALSVGFSNAAPADATVYYFGAYPGRDLNTNADYSKVFIPKQGFIRAGVVNVTAFSTTGTNENIIMAIRLNNTTDFTFATVGTAIDKRTFANYLLSIPVIAGDYIEMKFTAPTWATNPTGVYGGGCLYIELP
jgi:hypothetical protein